MVFEGDYVRSFLPAGYPPSPPGSSHLQPRVPSASAPIEVGGNVAVLLPNSAAGKRLLRFLATPEAGEVWARGGGFISPNHNVPLSDYPDAISRQLAAASPTRPRSASASPTRNRRRSAQTPPKGCGRSSSNSSHPRNVDEITRELQAGAAAAAACETAVGGDCY